MSKGPTLCPSACCEEGAILVGIILPNGSVAFASDRIEVDKEFVDIARKGRTPEKRFRFGNRCVENACKQWAGRRSTLRQDHPGPVQCRTRDISAGVMQLSAPRPAL